MLYCRMVLDRHHSMTPNDRSYKTEAVVLRRMDFGETDFLLTLYTPKHGKVKAISKGARKPIARQTGQVELFARTHLVIHEGRELDVISQAESETLHTPFQENLDLSLYASHFTELLDQFAYEGEENRAAYSLIVAALGWLAEPEVDLKLLARYYEYRLLRVMGYEPSLFRCGIGDEDLEAEDQFFSPVEGGVVCNVHASGRDMMRISLPVFKILRHFSRSQWETVRALHPSEKQLSELERILHVYLTFLLERHLKSANFMRQLKRDMP
jgi:DNA repair protein RecO (recombination protein O)